MFLGISVMELNDTLSTLMPVMFWSGSCDMFVNLLNETSKFDAYEFSSNANLGIFSSRLCDKSRNVMLLQLTKDLGSICDNEL